MCGEKPQFKLFTSSGKTAKKCVLCNDKFSHRPARKNYQKEYQKNRRNSVENKDYMKDYRKVYKMKEYRKDRRNSPAVRIVKAARNARNNPGNNAATSERLRSQKLKLLVLLTYLLSLSKYVSMSFWWAFGHADAGLAW